NTGVATTIGYGISVGGSTPGTSGADNDNTTIQNNTITLAPIGIYANGTAAVSAGGDDNVSITGNSITYNGTLASLGIQVGNALTSSISQNTISEETTTTQAPTAISLETGFVSSTVTRNSVTKALTTNTGGYGGRGITVGTGTASSSLTISNNCIAGVNGTNWSGFSNSSSMGIGIGMIGSSSTITTTAGGLNIYNNTVNMTGSMGAGSTSAITAAIYVGTGASALDIRNNLFVNTQVGTAATQKNYAIYSDVANTAFTNINRNDYFVSNSFNAPSAFVGRIGGTDRADIVAWRTGSGQDLQSFTEAPTFVSSTDLHLNMGLTSTRLESGGASVGVTVDIDGQTRPGPAGSVNGGATSPDVGCDEFDGVPAIPMTYVSSTVAQVTGGAFPGVINQEIIRIQVVTAGNLSPLSVTSLDLNATGTSVITDINASTAKVYYTGASTTFSTGTLFGATTPTLATFTVAGTQTLLTGNNYFWLAYDVIASPTGPNIDGECTSITVGTPQTPTVTAPAGNKVILGPMSGNYNVGAGQLFPNFVTITEAVSNLNGRGVSAAVTITLMDATYNAGSGESFPLNINAITGASATNTITIKPGTGVTATITGAAASGAVISALNTSYLTIDGSNNGTTTRNLTISNTSTTAPQVIALRSSSMTPFTNVTVKNCEINNCANTSSAIVVVDNAVTPIGGYFNNVTIQNNVIKKAYIGTYLFAATAAGNGSGTVVAKNDLTATGVDAIRLTGIYLQGIDGATVSENTIANFNGADNEDDRGIWLATNTKNATVEKNIIQSLTHSGTGGYGGQGVVVTAGLTAANINIVNNMIAGLSGDGWSYTSIPTDNPIGISLSTTGTQDGINIYNNSINLAGNTLNQTSAMSMGVYLSAGSTANIRNNIIVNNLGLSGAIGYGSSGIYAVTSNAQFAAIDYNDYVVAPTGSGTKFIGQIAATGSATLAAWQTATAQDANSVDIVPVFTSATDLHLPDGSNPTLFDLGTPIAASRRT
ncbi:MAG: hypothetical protein IPN76_15135, partial [Saprospiraceae bacterium]|nr:hypothetical protein [Saprospiraceae bacterium]